MESLTPLQEKAQFFLKAIDAEDIRAINGVQQIAFAFGLHPLTVIECIKEIYYKEYENENQCKETQYTS